MTKDGSLRVARADFDTNPSRVTNPPDEIYLVYGDLDEDSTHEDCAEVCWERTQCFDTDVRYVRADLATRPPSQPSAMVPAEAEPVPSGRWHDGWVPYSSDEMPPVSEPVLVSNDKRRVFVSMLMPHDAPNEGYYWCEHRQERGAINDPNCFEAPPAAIAFCYWRPLYAHPAPAVPEVSSDLPETLVRWDKIATTGHVMTNSEVEALENAIALIQQLAALAGGGK